MVLGVRRFAFSSLPMIRARCRPVPVAAMVLILAGIAQTPALTQTLNSFGINEKTPIEITADAFEVRSQSQVGVFEGNVRVLQGRLTVAADVLEVHYAEEENSDAQSIKRLEARGDVRISSPDEQAQGAWARYDVAQRTMVLGGGVLLTRGPDVLEGARLTIDLEANVSRLTPYGKDGEPAAPTGPTKGRVRAIFTPPGSGDEESPEGS